MDESGGGFPDTGTVISDSRRRHLHVGAIIRVFTAIHG